MSESAIVVETPLHYFRGESRGESRGKSNGQGEPGVVIREAPLLGQLNLRGDASQPEFAAAVAQVLGVPVPMQACTCATTDDVGIYWLGPDAWLLVVSGGREAEVESQLREALPGHFSVVDVSGGQTLVNVSGEGVATLLKKISHYDFHPTNFGPGRCVHTSFAKATALVSQREDGSFDLVIRRSFADYLARWLLDAGAESGIKLT